MTRETIARACGVLVLALVGCHSEGSAPAGGSSAAGETAAETATEGMTDAEIAHVLATANDAAIQQARAAMPRLVQPNVVTYAEAMIAEHQADNDELTALMVRLAVDAEDNALSQELRAESSDTVDTLEAAPPRLIDRLYLEAQVVIHTRVIESLDARLLAEADDPALIAFLEDARIAEGEHLERVQKLLSTVPAT